MKISNLNVYNIENIAISKDLKVSFDLTCSNRMWTELERYNLIDFKSNQSIIQEILNFDFEAQCNKYVDNGIIILYNKLKKQYNDICAQETDGNKETIAERKNEAYLKLFYNIPSGFELTYTVDTDYKCLLNIYIKEKDNIIPEWKEFCEQLLTLPLFKEITKAYFSDKRIFQWRQN